MTYYAPTFGAGSFTCPHCNAFAHMHWFPLYYQSNRWNSTEASIVNCSHCHKSAFWLETGAGDKKNATMIYPSTQPAPLPHPEMPPEIRVDFEEARAIAQNSPRAAAALLRLCVQKLCKQLGEPGKNINDDIGSLVKKGLPAEIQQALDIVRVIGNNAVHPGEIRGDDIAAVTSSLFEIVNHIVEDRIARPKKLATLFSALPDAAIQSIRKRDG